MRAGMALAGALLAACAAIPAHQPGGDSPIDCRPLPDETELCLALAASGEDRWSLRQRGKTAIPLRSLSFTDAGTASFGEFSISPTGRWLAVSIAEEGHPSLLFRSLDAVLEDAGNEPALPLIAIYPGSLRIEGWKNESTLIISSDQNLLRPGEGVLTDGQRRYLVELPEGRIGPASLPE